MRIVRWRLRTGPHLVVLDACAAVVAAVAYAALAGQSGSDGLPHFVGPAWAGWLVAVGVGAPLAVRRLWPLPALAVVLGASVAATLLDITRDPYVATALVGYAVALTEPARRAAVALALTLAASATAVLAGEAALTPSGPWSEAVGTAALVWLVVGAAWAAGRIVRERRARAARRELRLTEEVRAEERLGIAREVHDIVSHSLSVIVVKAAVANHVAEERPEETRDALRAIEQTGREALTEMRRALGMLRADATGRTEAGTRDPGGAATAPPPGLADLPRLVQRAEQAGVRTELATQLGAALPAGTALTVYRIVQEALTNVVKHAGDGAHCQVTIGADAHGGVAVEVVDDGTGGGPAVDRADLKGGHGLVGMRERVMMYGGTLSAGPRPDGGFAVSARLPAPAPPLDPPHGAATGRRERTP